MDFMEIKMMMMMMMMMMMRNVDRTGCITIRL
jgi:hypothetical protein